MALIGPDCSRAVYGQVTMAFPGGNIIEEAPEEIAAALALVAANQPGGVAVALRIRVTDAAGNILNCCPDGYGFDSVAGYCKLVPPGTPPPPPPPTVPPTTLVPPTCPPGYTFNPTTEMCDLGPIIIPGPGGGGGGGGGGGTPPPPPTPSCPPGFHWDATIEMCVADPLPIIPPQPGGNDGDEFTDCCQETLLALEAIRAAIAALHGTVGGGNNQNSDCCTKVVAAIGVVAQGLAAVAQAIIQKPVNVNVALDFTPLVDAVTTLKASLDALPTEMSADTDKLVTALDGIKETLVGPPTTFRPLPPDVDVDALIQYEVDNYALDSGAAQLITTPKPNIP